MDEASEIEKDIKLGFSAEDFLMSDLGVFISQKAETERSAAIEELIAANPFDVEKVAQLQSRVAIADAAMQWLADAVILGQQAQERMRQLEQPD